MAALEHKCNIIPITETFEWPPTDSLPDDMKQIVVFNGIKYVFLAMLEKPTGTVLLN